MNFYTYAMQAISNIRGNAVQTTNKVEENEVDNNITEEALHTLAIENMTEDCRQPNKIINISDYRTTMTFNDAVEAIGLKPMNYPKKKVSNINEYRADKEIKNINVKFYSDLFGSPAQPKCYTIGINGISNGGKYYDVDLAVALKDGLDVYFTPNTIKSGVRKVENITSYNAFFADFDAGRNENGSYKTLAEVSIYKEEVKAHLTKFPKCSYRVSTRNGYHVYWIIDKAVRACLKNETWQKYEDIIVNALGSDLIVKDSVRILRLPSSHWIKSKEGLAPHFTTIEEANDVVYHHSKLEMLFSEVAASGVKPMPQQKKPAVTTTTKVATYKTTASDNVSAIKALKPFIINSNTSVNMTTDEFKNYIKQQDMREYLNFPSNFSCILHDDNTKSTYILPPTDTNDQWIYYCHSSNCNTTQRGLDIISVTQQLAGIDFPSALRYLATCYNVALPLTKLKKKPLTDVISGNRNTIDQLCKIGYGARLSSLSNAYNALLKVAQQTTAKTGIQDPLFSVAQSHIAKLAKEAESKVGPKVNLLAVLGLITKVNDNDLPATIVDRDSQFNSKYKGKDTIQYFRIVDIGNLKSMAYVTKQLLKLKKAGIKTSALTEKTIIRIYGYEIAEAVYPKVYAKAQKNGVVTATTVLHA